MRVGLYLQNSWKSISDSARSDDIRESNFFLYMKRTKHTSEFFCLINRDLDANTAVIQGLILSFKCVNHKHGGYFTTFYIAVVLGNSRGGFRVETDQNSWKY